MNLPRKDENGESYLSDSQIKLFLKDQNAYYKQYILGEPFLGNAFTEFGLKVGKAIETNNYDGFAPFEQTVLKKVPRLDHFEKEIKLRYDEHGFYLKGFIDTVDAGFNTIMDYKTGGKDKEHQYSERDYVQLCFYTLGLRQQYCITPKVGQVCFIRRGGNPFKGEELYVRVEKPLIIPVDISETRLKNVYWNTIKVAKMIEEFYLKNKPNGTA
jgi:hypothetical protein